MEKFRRKLQIRRLMLILLALFVVAVCVLDVFFKREPVTEAFMRGLFRVLQSAALSERGLLRYSL